MPHHEGSFSARLIFFYQTFKLYKNSKYDTGARVRADTRATLYTSGKYAAVDLPRRRPVAVVAVVAVDGMTPV